jgi:5-formyltetrahydrofolate cyclo-ligase
MQVHSFCMTVAASKQEIRGRALARRAALRDAVAELSRRLAERFVASIPLPSAAVVSAYVAIGDEADPTPLLKLLRDKGHKIVLPRVTGRGRALDFHVWDMGATLVPGGFGLSEPSAEWPKIDPDVLVVPLLAFDASGYRIGYGAGFYDRTLAKLRASRNVTAVGFAFAEQEFAPLPHDDKDERLDWIVTQHCAGRFER